LLRKTALGDGEAWRRLVDLYGPLLYGWARKSGLQPQDAADVVQEMFRAVFANLADFRHEGKKGKFRAWLRAVAHSKLCDHWRRGAGLPETGGEGVRRRLEEVPVPDPSSSASPLGLPAQYEQVIAKVKGEFEVRTWQAFWRVTVENGRPADVAAELGVSVNAVYTARSRVLRRLRDELGPRGDGGPACNPRI